MTTTTQPEDISIDREAAAATRKQATVTIARSDVDNLRDDPEAKAAFLSTFSAEEEKAIIRKVDRRFLVLIGLMYMIKTVSLPGLRRSVQDTLQHNHREG